MSSNVNNNDSGGVGLLGLVFIVFLVLKLCHVINWSWWWVTAPLWGGLALFAVIAFIVLLVFLGGSLLHKFKKK